MVAWLHGYMVRQLEARGATHRPHVRCHRDGGAGTHSGRLGVGAVTTRAALLTQQDRKHNLNFKVSANFTL